MLLHSKESGQGGDWRFVMRLSVASPLQEKLYRDHDNGKEEVRQSDGADQSKFQSKKEVARNDFHSVAVRSNKHVLPDTTCIDPCTCMDSKTTPALIRGDSRVLNGV
jgi:hypothetical protein